MDWTGKLHDFFMRSSRSSSMTSYTSGLYRTLTQFSIAKKGDSGDVGVGVESQDMHSLTLSMEWGKRVGSASTTAPEFTKSLRK
jgi:hypothetical protein